MYHKIFFMYNWSFSVYNPVYISVELLEWPVETANIDCDWIHGLWYVETSVLASPYF